VKYTKGTRNDDVIDVRGKTARSGTGMKLGAGGIGVALIVLLVSRLTGVDLSNVVGSSGGEPAGGQANGSGMPSHGSGPDPYAALIDKINDVMLHVQDTWTTVFRDQVRGTPYRRAKLKIFEDGIDTKCGYATSDIGPFYCPGDENAYIDLRFYKTLDKLGGPGDFAQMYVLAHEIGHHVQTILGAEEVIARANPSETKNERSVRQELQADCYAGIWANAARDRLEAGDLEEALDAAKSIGDDTLQKRGGGTANPESFSHGTSAQRMKWFRRGFETARVDACDTATQPI
jgi:uncharacterized protein